MPRAEPAVYREGSTTSALHACTALPALAATARPACGERLRTPKADGARRGAGVRSLPGHPARGSQPGSAPRRPRSGASPQAPPKLSPAACARSASPPGLNALSLPPCRGDGEAGSLPPSSSLPPPPRPGSPARRSLAEAPALHRRAGARRCPPAPRRRPRPRLAVWAPVRRRSIWPAGRSRSFSR